MLHCACSALLLHCTLWCCTACCALCCPACCTALLPLPLALSLLLPPPLSLSLSGTPKTQKNMKKHNSKKARFITQVNIQSDTFSGFLGPYPRGRVTCHLDRTSCPPQISQPSARILGQAAAQILTASWDIESRSGRHFPKVPITSKNFSGANTRIYGFLERKLAVHV